MLVARGIGCEVAARVARNYGLVTLHRPSNVDDPRQLEGLLRVLADVSERLPLIFTTHPRTRARIEASGLGPLIERAGFHAVPPLSYLEALGAIRSARVVITDSGGLQEETTALGVPCLTVRDNTERPITITEGTNELVGSNPHDLLAAAEAVLAGESKAGRIPEFWDGHAAGRIAAVISDFLAAGSR
jgi:UDP-N-acetylglucosamine 2-epimerase (non-hydrolysing)